jgi:hypothetical protein
MKEFWGNIIITISSLSVLSIEGHRTKQKQRTTPEPALLTD